MEYIAFDAHKHYTLASVARPDGQIVREQRLPHERGALQQFLTRCEPGSPVAVETSGNWYWIIDEIEAAGCVPKLVHARKAKLMMGAINKTDKLDVRGLNQLQRNGTLPTVWIPPGELRDQRDLPRTRMVARPPAHAAQESDSRHLGQVRPPPSGGERSLRRAGPRPPAAASRSPAAVYGLRHSATSRAGRESGPSGARVRALDADRVQAHAHDSAAPDPSRHRAPARCRDRARGGAALRGSPPPTS
jgi:hypothetical protein